MGRWAGSNSPQTRFMLPAATDAMVKGDANTAGVSDLNTSLTKSGDI
jgi:hypothetical protein